LGDVKMMAMVGFFLGPKLTLMTIFLASVAGSIIGIPLALLLVSRPSYYKRVRRCFRQTSNVRFYFILFWHKQRRLKVPFGCFLSVAALAAALWGRPLLDWYLGYWG